MSKGGVRKGAGRKPGSPNKRTIDNVRAIGEIAKEYTEEAIATLAGIMRDVGQSGPARVSAADKLLERGWGKAIAQVEVGKPGDFSRKSDDELERFIAERTRRISLGSRGAGDASGKAQAGGSRRTH